LLKSPGSDSEFRYVSQCPRGTVEGFITLDHFSKTLAGWAYHEQGWFNDRPEKLGSGWFWYHFLDPEWNLFGTSGGHLFVQYRDLVLRGGLNAAEIPGGMRDETYAHGYEGRVISGGSVLLDYSEVSLKLDMDPQTFRPLLFYESADSEQLWSTALGSAELSWQGEGLATQVRGQVILETCWLSP
jgi:hypothetical protein